MAKKNGETTEGEAPVKKAPANSEDKYAGLRAKRRELEAELAGIDSLVRDAINAGDLKALEKLQARKDELPKLFIAASVAETAARQEIFNAEDAANLKALEAAETARDELRAAMVKLQARHAEEFAALQADLIAAEVAVGDQYVAITGARTLGASQDEGFRKALAAIAGV